MLEHAGVAPSTARAVTDIVLRPLEVILVVVVALLIAHFGAKAIRRGLRRPAGRAVDRIDSPRAGARAATVISLLANLFRAFVAVVAFFTILGIIGIDLTPLLASATVIGATIGFGAQTLVRDYLSGFLLTIEDQFGIGDTICTNTITGVVEELSLRVTRLRAFDGTVWFVPNGDIRQVSNASRGWARAVVDITVSPGGPEDLDRMERLLADAAAEVAHRPRFAAGTTEPPQVLGVVAADGTSCTLRVAVRTTATDHLPLERALRQALLSTLSAEGFWPPGPPAAAGPAPAPAPA